MEPIESSETSAYNNTLTPGTYPKEKILQSSGIVYIVPTVEGTIYTTPEDGYNVNRNMSGFLPRF